MLVEYEEAEAHLVRFQFENEAEAAQFSAIADDDSPITALRSIGRLKEARRVILNTITLALVSDCMHHIFEALRCMERRKYIVALNLLRKPLLDNLFFLSWILAGEDEFYSAFTTQSPAALAGRSIGSRRPLILASALSRTALVDTVDADWLNSSLFDDANQQGLYRLFQRAVHLVTTLKDHVRTEPENFNLIFKNHTDDDVYTGVYHIIPGVMLFLTHVIAELFHRINPMDGGSKKAFEVRSIYGFHLVQNTEQKTDITRRLSAVFDNLACAACRTTPKCTDHNVARILMTDSFRCAACKRITPFPFSWIVAEFVLGEGEKDRGIST